MNIDYRRIADAVEWYKGADYTEIDVPWLVSLDAIYGTLPLGHQPMQVSGVRDFGCLVGSAEQSFMEMMAKGTLTPGHHFAVTPCFRDEAVINEATRLSFMKVELIRYYAANEHACVADTLVLMDDARHFFESQGVQTETLRTSADDIPDMEKTYDLMAGDLELGSYGFRTWRGHRWVYGTGCAEPRLSIAQSRRTKQ